AKALTYSGLSVPASKVYDGTVTAVVSGTATLQATESAGGSTADGKHYEIGRAACRAGAETGTDDSKEVDKATTVNFGGVSVTGAGNGNHALSVPRQAPPISAKALTYSGLSGPASKVYDGTVTAVVSGTATLQGTETAGGSTADGKPY